MEFSFTRTSRGLVAPSEPTPSGVLELSVIDRLPALRCKIPSLHVFKHGGPEAAKVIREALSKVLIYYYPLAGRLRLSDQNELQVDCCGDGAWFVEASADCTLDDVNYFDDAKSVPYDKILPPPQESDDDPLVEIQVTQFRCNGFVVGLKTSHSVCDGIGAAQFMNALGEMAKGGTKQQPSITPVWCRGNLIKAAAAPLQIYPSDEPLFNNNINNNTFINVDNKLEHARIYLSLDKIKELKQKFLESSGGIKTCSTFEIVSAIVWRARTRAIMLPDETMKLLFYANCRHLFPQLPKSGFYGNCFYPVSVTARSETLSNMSVLQVVKLIQEAKARLPNEFWKWLMMKNDKDKEDKGVDPYEPSLDYRTMCITEWNGLGFKDVDYGWGKPVNIVPIHGNSSTVFPIAVLCSPCQAILQNGALRLVTWCVQQQHLQLLIRNINNNNIIN